MTEQETIELLQNLNVKLTEMSGHKINGIDQIFGWDEITAISEAIEAIEEIQKYRSIGTPDECRAAVDKQMAKKPIRNDKCTCPSCGTHNDVFKKRRNTVAYDIVYCWHCGQAVEINRLEGCM